MHPLYILPQLLYCIFVLCSCACFLGENLITHCQVFLMLGNDKANKFWGANIPPSECLCVSANSEQRLKHITEKYKNGKYRKYHKLFGQQEALNNVSRFNANNK